VATDFSPMGDIAVEHAANSARKIGSKLVILHVINSTTKKQMLNGGGNFDPVKKKLQEISQKVKNKYQIDVEYFSPEGSIFSTIAEVARDVGAKLLFLGTHGKRGIQFLLGSFALKVVKTSPSPMVVVQNTAATEFKSVIYPLDLEMGSKQKVNWANFLSKQFGSTIHILVFNINDDASQRKLQADLLQVEKILRSNNVQFTSTIADARGSFFKQIIAHAKEKNADAIMISTDPDGLTWNPFGTLPERIIFNKEKIPVMCINSKDLKVIIGGP
jgi:nucleotide-binding universal stress UspA family protein